MSGGGAQPQTGAEEVGMAEAVVGERGSGCLDSRDVLQCSVTASSVLWVGDVGYVTAHWEDLGWLPPQGGPHTDRAATMEGTGWGVVIPHAGRDDIGGRTAGGGYIRNLPTEHSCTVH